MKETHVTSFAAVDEAGQQYNVNVFQDFTGARDRVGTVAFEGQKFLRTTSGQAVNRIDKGIYEIAASKIRLTSTDPNAP